MAIVTAAVFETAESWRVIGQADAWTQGVRGWGDPHDGRRFAVCFGKKIGKIGREEWTQLKGEHEDDARPAIHRTTSTRL